LRAVSYLQAAIDGGDAGAALELGDLYLADDAALGLDAAKAVSLYETAAAGGQRAALMRLGDLYRNGKFVPEDQARAISYYEQVLAAGDIQGALRLAELYVTAGNADQALAYFTQAAE